MYQNSIRTLSAVLLLCFAFVSHAQTGLLRGNIYDQSDGSPIIYCNVFLEGTTYGTTTDINGFFTLPGIPEGDYFLMASYIGYDTVRAEIKIQTDQITYKSMYMSESAIKLGVINISARKQRARNDVQISKVRVTPRQIKALPSAGGEADIAQYLQVIPGIISTGDQGGQIFIRGGAPVQNKIMLDGLNIYNPFHSIGFFSIFETELIKNVDVFTGGFDAQHGGRISAVVDIQTRDGNKKRQSGFVSGSPFIVKGMLEGPITKFEEGKTNISYVLTGKHSIIDQTSLNIYSHAAVSDTIGLPFEFTDLYGKVSLLGSTGSRMNLFGFNFEDGYNNPAIANVKWTNSGGGANFTIVPSSSNLLMDGIVGYSRYNIELGEADEEPRSSKIRELVAAMNFSFFGTNSEIRYGLELKSVRTDFSFTNPFQISLSEVQNTTEISTYVKYKQILGNLILEPSFRLQYYASLSAFSPEPRIGLKYNISESLRFKAAGGIYTQNLLSTSNERDVVNLFTGFLSGPESRVIGLDGEPLTSKLQKSVHAIAGFEIDITDDLEVNVEGYFKDFPQLIVVNRNKVNSEDSNYAKEEGEAYGIDFSLRYENRNFYLWSTYSYGFVNRYDGEQDYPTAFDRRHNVNLLGTYTFGGSKDWEISARWNFGSGFPFTKTQGFYDYQSFFTGVGTEYETENPDFVGIIYSDERNGGRLPYYHRLDLSIKKMFEFSENIGLEVIASVTNVYDRKNIFYFDRVRYERVDQLPVIPSLGAKVNF